MPATQALFCTECTDSVLHRPEELGKQELNKASRSSLYVCSCIHASSRKHTTHKWNMQGLSRTPTPTLKSKFIFIYIIIVIFIYIVYVVTPTTSNAHTTTPIHQSNATQQGHNKDTTRAQQNTTRKPTYTCPPTASLHPPLHTHTHIHTHTHTHTHTWTW